MSRILSLDELLKLERANRKLTKINANLLIALKDLVKAHKVKMGKSAINLRLELANDIIKKAKEE